MRLDLHSGHALKHTSSAITPILEEFSNIFYFYLKKSEYNAKHQADSTEI